MYKKVFLILCSIILLGVLASCGQDDYDDGYDNAPPPPDHISGRITLYNDTSFPISEIYLRPSNTIDWGSNELISSTGLLQGELWTFDVRIPDDSNSIIVDLKVATTDTSSTYYAYIYNIRIDAREKVDLSAMQPDLPESLEIVYVD